MRARSSFLGRSSLLLLAVWLVGACGTTGAGTRGASGKTWVVVGLGSKVDRRAPAVAELLRELSSRAKVEVVAAKKRARAKSAESTVKRALTRGRKLYTEMKMEEATEQFERALERVRVTFAKELTSTDLAQLHLHLAAVRYAKQRMGLFKRHCRAAAGYDPKLVPNADIFSPPVRKCIEQAKGNLVEHQVSLIVKPADGPVVILDGSPIVDATAMRAIPAGEHFLRVEHPLYQTWGRALYLSASAQIEVKLRPATPAVIVDAALKDERQAKLALPLLGAHALVLLRREGPNISMHAYGPKDELKRTLAEFTPSAVLASSAAGVVNIAGTSPRPAASAWSQPTSQAVAKRPLWKNPWLWGAVGAGVLAAVIIPLAASGGGDGGEVIDPGTGRPVRLELPW